MTRFFSKAIGNWVELLKLDESLAHSSVLTRFVESNYLEARGLNMTDLYNLTLEFPTHKINRG